MVLRESQICKEIRTLSSAKKKSRVGGRGVSCEVEQKQQPFWLSLYFTHFAHTTFFFLVLSNDDEESPKKYPLFIIRQKTEFGNGKVWLFFLSFFLGTMLFWCQHNMQKGSKFKRFFSRVGGSIMSEGKKVAKRTLFSAITKRLTWISFCRSSTDNVQFPTFVQKKRGKIAIRYFFFFLSSCVNLIKQVFFFLKWCGKLKVFFCDTKTRGRLRWGKEAWAKRTNVTHFQTRFSTWNANIFLFFIFKKQHKKKTPTVDLFFLFNYSSCILLLFYILIESLLGGISDERGVFMIFSLILWNNFFFVNDQKV